MLDTDLLFASLPAIASAAIVTIKLTVAAGAISLIVGTLSAALQLSGSRVGYVVSRSYVSFMRGTPLFVQLLVVFFSLPMIGITGQAFAAAAIAIGLNSGAYTTEIQRAAILAIPPGQVEAAQTIGMSRSESFRRIVLPQAIAISLPALTAELTIVLKSTPLASVVAVTEMTYTGVLIQARTFSALEVFVPIAIGYIALSLTLTQVSRTLERRFAEFRP